MLSDNDSDSEWSTSGYILQYDEIVLNPEIWELSAGKTLSGKSGVQHNVDFLAESGNGRMIFLNARCSADSILEVTGKLHAVRLDLGVEKGFIICSGFHDNRDILKGNQGITDLIISGVKLGKLARYPRETTEPETKPFAGQHSYVSLKRDRTKIIADIMQLLNSEKNGITGIIYKCNLNYNSATRIINDLLDKKYIELQKDDRKSFYSLTPDGREVLKVMNKLLDLNRTI